MSAKKTSSKKSAKEQLLRLWNVDAGYGQLQILTGVDITLHKGDFAVIIGPNGSGKSTTVKSVFGLTTQYTGTIVFDGQDITHEKTHTIVHKGIGYVPQGRLVFDTLTIEENLEMGGFGLSKQKIAERKEHVLKIFPKLRERMKHQAGFLSGGQQQMLSIARALMKEPKLLLLDEPSLGLDPITQQHIFDILKKINDAGTTIMMVEQNAHQALKYCSHAYVVESGKVVAKGGPSLAKQKRIQELYLGGA